MYDAPKLYQMFLQDFAAVIATADLQILRTGGTNPVTEYKLSFDFHIRLNGPF